MRTTVLALALVIAAAAPAAAQQLTVEFHDGLVTVDATSVPVRTILNEWSKKGGTKVVGVDAGSRTSTRSFAGTITRRPAELWLNSKLKCLMLTTLDRFWTLIPLWVLDFALWMNLAFVARAAISTVSGASVWF